MPRHARPYLTQAYLDAELAKIKNRSGSTYDYTKDSLEAQGDITHHTTCIFPEGTDETLTFIAGGVNNQFGIWAEVIDSGANKFSDKLTRSAHLTAFMIEEVDTRDKAYAFEIAYGDAKESVSCYRFIAGQTVKLPTIQQMRIRGEHIPSDEKVYYRMKCETADAECILHIRYYMHRA